MKGRRKGERERERGREGGREWREGGKEGREGKRERYYCSVCFHVYRASRRRFDSFLMNILSSASISLLETTAMRETLYSVHIELAPCIVLYVGIRHVP